MSGEHPGRRLVQFDVIGTGLFAVAAVVAVALDGWPRIAAAALDVALFVIGCAAFLWAYAVAVGRSRTDDIAVSSLFFLTHGVAPRRVQVTVLGMLGLQTAIALVSASLRPFTSLAFGVLVPMFGLGLAGLWAARHGSFPPRHPEATPGQPGGTRDVVDDDVVEQPSDASG